MPPSTDRALDAVTIDAARRDVVFQHVEMAIIGIFLVAKIFIQVVLHIALGNLRRQIGQPIQKFADEMIMLGAVKSRLLLGQLALRPELEERMVLAMLFVPGRD